MLRDRGRVDSAPTGHPAALDDEIHHRRQRRIAHALPVDDLVGEKRAVVLPARMPDAVVIRDRASERSPRRARHPARPVRRPASATGTCALPPESPRGRAQHRPRSRRRASLHGKSCPLAIIWVPTSTSIVPPPSSPESTLRRPCVRTVSRSRRRNSRRGQSDAISSATRSVPNPRRSRYGPAHSRDRPAAPASSSCSSDISPGAGPALGVHDQRHTAVRAFDGARRTAGRTRRSNPRRFSRIKACCPRFSRSSMRALELPAENDIGAVRPHTPARMSTMRTEARGRS